MNTVLRARMDQANSTSRSAPDGWEAAIAKLARDRAEELVELGGGGGRSRE